MVTAAEGVRFSTAAALLLLGLNAPIDAAPALQDHPFPKRNQLPLNLLFLDQTPRSALLLAPRAIRLSLFISHESTLVGDHDLHTLFADDDFATLGGLVSETILANVAAAGGTSYFIDGETTRMVLEGTFGIGPRVEIGADIPLLLHSAGRFDAAIDRYHERFGFADGGRPNFVRYRFVGGYVGDGESVFVDGSPGGVGLGDIVLGARTALLEARGRRPALSAGLSLKLATGDAGRLEGSGHSDYGLGLQLSEWIGRSTIHCGYSYTFSGGWALAPGLPMVDLRSLFAAYAFNWTPRRVLIAQVLRSSGAFPYRAGGDLGTTATEMSIGMRHLLARGDSLEWGLIESLSPDQNTTDVGLFFGLSFMKPGGGTGSRTGSLRWPGTGQTNQY
jgi:hypothetical protein